MYSPRQKLLWFAFSTRVMVLVLQAVTNFIIPDHVANVFVSPEDANLRRTWGDAAVDTLLGGLKRWDAQYFIHIAQYGYTYENCLAFFPFFPLVVRYVSYGLNSVVGSFLNIHSSILISATVINLIMFIKSADILHRLSLRILRSESKAYKSVVLYCVNPASIFFSAPYSETLFAFMSFYTMLKCTENETLRFANIDIVSGLPAGFSMITRSNGSYIQNHYWDVGLFKYYRLKQIPNFLLASPILFLIMYHCMSYIKNNPKLCFTLGIRSNFGYTNKVPYRQKQYSKSFGANDPSFFVYIVHMIFLCIFCIMFVHIQVSTRLLASASPVLYWIGSYKMNVGPTPTSDQNTINEHFRRIGIGKRIPSHHLSIANLEGVDNMYSKWKTFIISRWMPDFQSRLIQYYFLGYFLIGTVLFSNFYPWT
ncbi:hypothetical protein MSG28_012289 [Choristoneura fumiferana]|uniref:Uncharacterized protein n=1 Tax=Choristoneura fumiferana TaxID=7141 RepID=A0ACC0KCH1_CHOFU|nr:hypothetical protein MSG28_012289 [Choristoneura fumiferana]